MSTRSKDVVQTVESGRLYVPPPPSISLYKDEHKKLDGKVVGDTIHLAVDAHITEYDEEGRYQIELDEITISDPESETVKQATSEIVNLGTISPESLGAIFNTKPKNK